MATSPFAVYYDTEARMYSLVILLSTLAVLAYVAILSKPTVANVLGLAALCCALLYTHYWALYLVATAAVGTALCALFGPRARSCWMALGALVAGTCGFLPWVPTLLYQLHHTGTPWASPADFTALVFTFTQFAGGDSDAGRALALVFAFLGLLALAGSALDGRRVVLDLRTRPGVRALALLAGGTLLLALIAGKLAGSTFADRYSAVILTPCLLVVAYGTTVLADRRVRQGIVAAAVAFGLAASVPNAFLTRTQAGHVALAVLARARARRRRGLLPRSARSGREPRAHGSLRRDRLPDAANSPEIVNWVDYAATVEHANPAKFARIVLQRAGSRGAIWYVWAPGYLNYGDDCQAIASDLAARRPMQQVVAEQGSDTPFEIFEGENLYRYPS